MKKTKNNNQANKNKKIDLKTFDDPFPCCLLSETSTFGKKYYAREILDMPNKSNLFCSGCKKELKKHLRRFKATKTNS